MIYIIRHNFSPTRSVITSQLMGKGYKDSDYTFVITIMQWHKRIVIVQKLTLVVEVWALLSSHFRLHPSGDTQASSNALGCSYNCRWLTYGPFQLMHMSYDDHAVQLIDWWPIQKVRVEPATRNAVATVMHWCLRAETHPCGNCVSAVLMFCLRFGRRGSLELDQLSCVVITWCVLIGTSHKLATYNYTSSLAHFEQCLSTSWWMQTESAKVSESSE